MSTNHNIRRYVGDVDHFVGEQVSVGKWVVADRHPFAGAKTIQLSLAVARVLLVADGQKLI